MRYMASISGMCAIACSVAIGLHAGAATAQSSGGPYRIDAVLIAAGGGTLAGDGLQLRGSFGQPQVGAIAASTYRLNGGFVGADDGVFHNGFEFQ